MKKDKTKQDTTKKGSTNKFDDIVLYIEYNDNRKDLFFLQLKHKELPGQEFPIHCLVGGTKKFHLGVYEVDFFEFKKIEETFYKQHDIPDDVKNFFCIYTNYIRTNQDDHPKLHLQLVELGEINDILNSSLKDCNFIYKVEDSENRCKEEFLNQFYLWFNQINEADVETRIRERFKLNCVAIKSLIYYFVRRFDPPKKDQKLTMREMIRRLLEIFFENYEIPQVCFTQRTESTKLLDVIKSFKITHIKQNISEIRLWCDILENIEDSDDYLRINGMDKDNLSKLREIYLNLVLENKLPFFIKTSNPLFSSFREVFLHKICDCVVIYSDKKENVHFVKSENRILEFISDIKDEKMLSKIQSPKVSLQGKPPVDLLTLVRKNPKPKQKLDVDLLFKYTGKIIEIGQMEHLPDYYINRKINVPVIKLEDILSYKSDKRCFVIVFNCCNEKASTVGLIHLVEYLSGRMRTPKKYYPRFYVETSFQPSILNLLSVGLKTHIHCFQMMNEDSLCIPIHKIAIRQCGLTEKLLFIPVEDEEIIKYCSENKVNIICDNAGQGKTMLLKFIAKKFPPEKWVNYIDLTLFSNLFKIKDPNILITEINELERNNTDEQFHDIFSKIYNICLNNKDIVWLVDDYEEIQAPSFLNILNEVQKEDLSLWIASRPLKRIELENFFRVNIMQMIHATSDDQLKFFERYFSSADKRINVADVLSNINSIRSRMDESFIGIFQQMAMLAEMFKVDPKKPNVKFEIIDIYQEFIEMKLSLYKNHHQEMIKLLIQKLAMAHLLSEEVLEKYVNIKELEAQMTFFKSEYQKGTIVTHITDENVPIFSHKTYSEYLTAKWLKEYVDEMLRNNNANEKSSEQKVKVIMKMLYLQKLRTVRYFFDAIVSKNIPILSAVTNRNYSLMERSIRENRASILSRDILGRTFAHYLIGNESQYDIYWQPRILRVENDQERILF